MSADQDQRMRQVLGELELLSHGTTQRLDPTGDGDGLTIAAGATKAPHEHWREQYAQAETVFDRERAIWNARLALADWRGYGHPPRLDLPTDAQILAGQILDIGVSWSAADVAHKLRCSVTIVRKVRKAAGIVDPEHAVVVVEHVDAQRMRELSGRGMTVPQIAMLTHATRADVHKALKRKAG